MDAFLAELAAFQEALRGGDTAVPSAAP